LDCFEDRKLAARIYTNPFRLADVTTLDDGEIMQHKRMALLTLIQKHIRRRDMTELLDSIVKLLSYNYYTDNQVITLFNYLIQEGNAQKPMEFITEIAKQSEKHKGALMTIAQQIEQIGIQKGIQQGIQKGIQIGEQNGMQKGKIEGEKQASMKIARQLLEKGVERDIVKLSTGLTDTEMSNLFKD
ncbi:Rpn family recombination-promoting nuclease/putative transposase, partial [Arsenophonus nasoniae]|uniref:Rpn family recombination-promoting nuclease/putative transposase n=1 Tax=Arsenophonus nasoniae TaxID=638 RepID=UPI0038792D94